MLNSKQTGDLRLDELISNTAQTEEYINTISSGILDDVAQKYVSRITGGTISSDIAITENLSVAKDICIGDKKISAYISDMLPDITPLNNRIDTISTSVANAIDNIDTVSTSVEHTLDDIDTISTSVINAISNIGAVSASISSLSILTDAQLATTNANINYISSAIDISQKIVEDRFTTKFEVLPTRAAIPAGTPSYLSVDSYRMFVSTCQWSNTMKYDVDQIITNSSTKKIYKAKLSSINKSTTNSTYWEDITEKYFTLSSVEKPISYHKYLNAVPAQTKQYFEFRSSHDVSQQNVVIDWGDGSEKTYLNAATETAVTHGNTTLSVKYPDADDDYELSFYVMHDYDSVLTSDNIDGKQHYIITIVGSTCWGIRSNSSQNIISRLWDTDLPFSDTYVNPSSLCLKSMRLLYVSLPAYFPAIYTLQNMSNQFQNCSNLQYMHGFSKYTWYQSLRAMGNMFSACTGLLKSDLRLPHLPAMNSSVVGASYISCYNLAMDVYDLLPVNGFSIRKIEMSKTFNLCKSLQNAKNPTFVADILWNDTSKIWKPSATFANCNSSLLSSISGAGSGWK